MRRVMLLDDEVNVLTALQRHFQDCFRTGQVRVETFTHPEQALLRTAEVVFDVVVSDCRMLSGGC